MNLQIAQVYLQHADPDIGAAHLAGCHGAMLPLKNGPTQAGGPSAMRDKAFDLIRSRKI